MGIWSRLTDVFRKSTTYSERPASWLVDWVRGGLPTASGVQVTAESAMRVSAVWACVNVRSGDIGKVPCHMYRRMPGGGKERAIDHPLYSLIRDTPNPRQTAFEFRQLLQSSVDLHGNGYALKEFDKRGRLIAMWPLKPSWVQVLHYPGSWELFYRIMIPGVPIETLPSEGVFHLRGISLDGMVGLSPIAHHRETIGLALATERYGAAFFGNSAQPNGALKMPGVLGKDAADALRSNWENKYRGPDNRGKLAIFDGGMEWVQTGMNNNDAQYMDLREFENQDIFRLYRMPPHKVGDLKKAAFANIEQQALEYVSDCLLTEAVRWEQALAHSLLTDAERGEYFFEFLLDVLLRGDFASRMAGYAVARNWGIFSADDCREKENMNKLPNGKGDIYLQPLNMIEAGTTPHPPSPPQVDPGLDPGNAKSLLAYAQYLVAIEDARGRKANGHDRTAD